MGERLRLTPVSGGGEITITGITRTHLNRGGDSTKFHVTGTADNTPVAYVERARTNTWVDNWRRFRTAGLPVPELYLGSNGGLYADDLMADGSRIYGISLVQLLSDRRAEQEQHPVDARFIEVMSSSQREAVHDEIRKYVDLANYWGLELPQEGAFELIVHPHGAENPWELVILDLAQAGTFELFDIVNPHVPDQARAANRRRGEASFESLKVLESKLRR